MDAELSSSLPLSASVKVAHLALLGAFVLYLAMVGANTYGFGYSFWNEPPPTNAASTFAAVSIWAFFLAAGFVGAIAYTWLCAHELRPDAPMSDALRAAARSCSRRWIAATVGFVATTIGCVFVVPGLLLVPWLAATPVRQLEADRWSTRAPSRTSEAAAARTGLVVVLLVAVPTWTAAGLGFFIVDHADGRIEALAAVLAYTAFVIAGLAAGWAAHQATEQDGEVAKAATSMDDDRKPQTATQRPGSTLRHW